jgi:putative flippase GtrA
VKRALVLARSMLASGAATLTDQGALLFAVAVLGVPARMASVPALVLAGVVNFLGNRSFAFRDGGGRLGRQAPRFALVQLASIALNALLFDLGMRALAGHANAYWALRLAVNSVVYLGWSFPMFGRVFRSEGGAVSSDLPRAAARGSLYAPLRASGGDLAEDR